MQPENQPRPIVIVGMHRSGTSMVTQLLQQCGLFLGDSSSLLQPHSYDNPTGYWENSKIVDFSDHLLHELGGTWSDPPVSLLSSEWRVQLDIEQEKQTAVELLQPLRNRRAHWGWKDPRTILLLPFWKELFPELRAVVCVRNPLEVAFSLNKRLEARLSLQDGLRLWEIYHKVLLKEMPSIAHVVTHYETHFYNPQNELKRLCDTLGLQYSNETIESAVKVIRPSLHRSIATEKLLNTLDVIPQDVLSQYRTLRDMAGSIYQQRLDDASYAESLDAQALPSLFLSTSIAFQHFANKYSQQRMQAVSLNHSMLAQQEELRAAQASLVDIEKKLLAIQEQLNADNRTLHYYRANFEYYKNMKLVGLFLTIKHWFHRGVLTLQTLTTTLDVPPLFDSKWYLHEYKDVAQSNIRPYVHYRLYGWRQGRNPGPDFDTLWYLAKYPTVASSGLDPLTHYYKEGRSKSYLPNPAGNIPDIRQPARQSLPLRVKELARRAVIELKTGGFRSLSRRVILWVKGVRRYRKPIDPSSQEVPLDHVD